MKNGTEPKGEDSWNEEGTIGAESWWNATGAGWNTVVAKGVRRSRAVEKDWTR